VKKLLVLPFLILLLPIQVRERGTAADGRISSAVTVMTAPESVQALSEYLQTIQDRGQSRDDQGVLLETLDDGQSLASHNADVTFNPASVMKLATSLVALAKLKPDYRYRYTFKYD